MRGDFTRSTFAQAKHYSGVRQQQGRVGLDADWNEQQDIAAYLRDLGLRDVVGRCGAPQDTAGFAIEPDGGGGLRIAPGRYYVGGVLCENDQPTPLLAQPDLPLGAPRVVQPDGTPVADAMAAGRYLVFLDVWSRLVTALDDDAIREKALGGPDTAARLKTVWQVKLLRVGGQDDALHCGSNFPGWTTFTTPATGTLAARAEADAAVTSPCEVPAGAGYRRLDNQLYRVEVHRGGAAGTATFVWSRENGSVERRWETRAGDDIRISSPGRDAVLGFPSGSWVELTDDTRELTGRAGTLVRVRRPRGDVLEVDAATATGSLDIAEFPVNPKIRRWDSAGALPLTVPATGDGWVPLEDGVQVQFTAGKTYRTGDYWTIPARTHSADVEWPRTGGVAAALAPHGVRHQYCHLAVARFDGAAWSVVEDCRTLFPPLTQLTSLSYVSGDGQEAVPDVTNAATLVPLPQALRVGVARGQTPVAGAKVRFVVTAGSGRVDGASIVTVTTGPDGTAACRWSLDSGAPTQQVTARLLDKFGTERHLPVVFTANHSAAALVAFDAVDCPPLAGTRTVQDALERLCHAGHGGGCAAVTVVPGENWQEQLDVLTEGQDAHICFQAGEYHATHPLVLRGLGHLVVGGCGNGTRIVCEGSETAVLFEGCRSAQVRDLSVETRSPVSDPEQIGSVLFFLGCDEVTVERVTVTSDVSDDPFRTPYCITVRPSRDSDRTKIGSVRSVRIKQCDLRVGHMQRGILLVSVERSVVEDNTLVTVPKPKRVTFDKLLRQKDVRGRLARTLASKFVMAEQQVQVDRGDFNTALRVEKYVVRFNSIVPEGEWQRLAAERPPTDDDLRSPETVTAYAQQLVDSVVEEPALLGQFASHVARVTKTVGQPFAELAQGTEGKALMRAMLLRDQIDVAEAPAALVRNTALRLGDARLAFDSPLSASAWADIVASMQREPVAVTPRSGRPGRTTPQVVRDAARRLVRDKSYRDRFPEARKWFEGLRDNNLPCMEYGLVIGGHVARHVRVENNTFDGCVHAVRVGLTYTGKSGKRVPAVAESVTVSGNLVRAVLPFYYDTSTHALYFAYCGALHVSENRISGQRKDKDGYALRVGVFVRTHHGPTMIVRHNHIQDAFAGVYFSDQITTQFRQPQWLVADNMVVHPQFAAEVPALVMTQNNQTQ